MKEKRRSTIRLVPASQAKNNFGEVIRRVYEDEETQVIERAGLPVAAIITMSDLERFLPEKVKEIPGVAMSAKRKRAWKELMAILNQPGSEKYSADEVEADVHRVVQAVRHGRRKK